MLSYSTVKQWLLPYQCILCGHKSSRKQDLCEPCFLDLKSPEYTCPRCARSLFEKQPLCGACIAKDPPFAATFSAFLYERPMTQLIGQLKFLHQLRNARILGELLCEKISQEWYNTRTLPEAILPIPLHINRLKERGFNQVLEIARPIAKTFQLPLLTKNCVRNKPTLAQAMLPAKQRQENIKNAFNLVKPIEMAHIAVMDDVITTGHTVVEFCTILKKSGVQQIDVWCVARPSFNF